MAENKNLDLETINRRIEILKGLINWLEEMEEDEDDEKERKEIETIIEDLEYELATYRSLKYLIEKFGKN